MQYGICPLSLVPIRTNPEDASAMLSQLLYGEHFKVLDQRRSWSRIRVAHDHQEGWVRNDQIHLVSQATFDGLMAQGEPQCSTEVISHICTEDGILLPVVLGSMVGTSPLLGHSFEGSFQHGRNPKENFIGTALLYLEAPYLAGGKSPFGIDGPAFVQMVHKINGYFLERTALGQSKQGEALSFIEESEPGDLAFFDDPDGTIDHVGMILPENHIIHVNGHVRIDRLDHTGIFNGDRKMYTHKLRVIKKIL